MLRAQQLERGARQLDDLAGAEGAHRRRARLRREHRHLADELSRADFTHAPDDAVFASHLDDQAAAQDDVQRVAWIALRNEGGPHRNVPARHRVRHRCKGLGIQPSEKSDLSQGPRADRHSWGAIPRTVDRAHSGLLGSALPTNHFVDPDRRERRGAALGNRIVAIDSQLLLPIARARLRCLGKWIPIAARQEFIVHCASEPRSPSRTRYGPEAPANPVLPESSRLALKSGSIRHGHPKGRHRTSTFCGGTPSRRGP
jgi:hypothetical protein